MELADVTSEIEAAKIYAHVKAVTLLDIFRFTYAQETRRPVGSIGPCINGRTRKEKPFTNGEPRGGFLTWQEWVGVRQLATQSIITEEVLQWPVID